MRDETHASGDVVTVPSLEATETEIVPKGYRQTDVGVIPEDWKIVQLSDLVTSGPRNGYSGRSEKHAEGTPTLSLAATSSGYLILNEVTVKRLYETIDPRSDLYLKSGDLLVQRSNTLDLVGTTVVFEGPSDVYVFPDLMMRLRFKDEATAHWVWRYANSADGRRYFVSIAAGSTGSMPKISGDKLRKMPLPAPPLPEQRAIASALSAVDALISSLDYLISKKRSIKTAAMQQLLTGKQRLRGYENEKGYRQTEVGVIPADWIASPISEIVQNIIDYRGRTPRKLGMAWGGGNIPALSARNVKMGFIDFEEETYFGTEALYNRWMTNGDPKKDDIVVTMEAPLGNVALIPDDQKYILSQRTILLQTNQHRVNNRYLVQLMRSKSFQKLLSENATGSTATGIKRRKFEKLEILLPPIPEQGAIAAVLSDMDTEIAMLEARREKTQQVKQGMMQELLTGRTRLVPEGSFS